MGGKKKKGLFGGIKLPKIKIGKDLGLKAVGKAVGNIANVATKAVKDTGTGVSKGIGDTVSQVGRTINDKGTIQAGKNITRESKKGMEIAAPILTQIAGNALTAGGYGAVSSLGNMAQSGKFDLGQAGSAVGSLAGFSPTVMQALQGGTALAKGDLKGAALAGLGSLGSSGGQNFLSSLTGGSGGSNSLISSLTNPNALKLATSALSGDKGGLASGLAGYAGSGDTIQNLVGALASGDKKGIAQGIGGAMGLSPELSRALSGAATGDNRDLAMGLLGSTGYVDPKRLSAMDALAGGKLTAENARNAFGGLLPSMGGGEGGSSSGGGTDWLKSIQDLGAGFSTGDYVPDAMKGLTTKGMLPYSTSGILPSISNPLSGMGLDLAAGGKGSENTATIKELYNKVFGGDGFQAGRGKVPDGKGFIDQVTDAVGNFVGNNKEAIGAAIEGGAGKAAFDRYASRWDERRDLSKKQIEDLSLAGEDYQAQKYDPQRYEEERQFLADRITGRGITDTERIMQKEGDIRAGRAAAGQRAAALEQMARTMGGSAGGSGVALATALSGGQSAMNVQSETNLAREASAQQNLERAYARRGLLSSLGTKEQADLMAEQARYRLDQLDRIATQRTAQAELQKEMGEKESGGAKEIGTAIAGLVGKYESPEAREKRKKMEALAAQKAQEEEAYKKAMAQAELDLKRAQVAKERGEVPTQQTTSTGQATTTQQTTTPPPTGQTPPPPKKTVPPPAGPTQSQVNQALNRGSYVIKQGDSLSKRYKDLGYNSWQEAYDANKDLIGDNPNLIKTGSSLRRKDEITDKRVSTPVQNMNKKYTNIA